uniref:C2H2-type domain-containing protein n=1 Tax=Ditylenchus dipsaci TaxID=166011 RepID=A0A915DEB3_9BILA
MPIREDVWSHDTCLVCQTQHSTPEEKEEHENEKMHKDRTVVYDFLSKELSCLVPSSSESILYERYYRANTSVAGLDCICELNFSWASSPFWACTICYVAGKTLESADAHLYSSYHKRTYISEYHPDRFAALIKAQQRSTPDKHSMIEQDAVLDVLYDSKGLAPPDVYILHEKERSWAFQKLGISEEEVPAEYVAEPIDDLHSIVHCYICCEDFVAYEKEELLQKAWSAHLATTTHQKCRFILTLLNEAKLEEKQGLPSFCEYRSTKTTDLGAFNCVEGAFYGKSCSFEHLVHFKGSNDSFCKICFCVVSNRDVTDHFASEYHIERCVRKNSPSKLLNAQFLKIEDRHAILLAGITDEMKVGKHHTCDAHFPQLLKRVGSVDKRAFEATNVEEVWVASFKANWCEDCKQYVKLTQKDSWQNHIFEEDHFDWAAKRALCYADGANFVSKSAGKSLPSFRTGQKGWDDRYSVALGLIPIQDHCYFGLQYIVRDELNRQTTCLCCYLVCSYEDDDVMCLHVRSYDHITRVIHLINKKLLGTLWKYTDVDQKKNLVMDYLKHCKLDMSIQRLSIYDPVMACTSNCFGTVPRLLLQLAAIPPELRQSSLLSIESRPNEDINVPLNIAFRSCNVEIKGLESDLVIFFCQECNQAFSCSFEKVDVCFAEHLLSPSHWARQLALKQNPFDENKRIYNLSSSFEVSRFQQPNEKKKITWKWNEARKAYEFVYAQLGLGDVHERRNFSSKRDLYCTLCAETLKASKIELEHHIRSFTHIFYYVHKHRPQTIGDLEAMLLKEEDLATKQKNIRKLFNKALKGLEKEQEEIIIFDFSQGRFCESTEIKAVLEDDHPSPLSMTTSQTLLRWPFTLEKCRSGV